MTPGVAVTLHRGNGGVFLNADNLPPGRVAVIDGDVVDHAPPGPVDAIIVGDNEHDHRHAAHAFADTAREIVKLLPDQPAGPVEVVGNGLLAQLTRHMLGLRAADGPGDRRPTAIVDATGSPERIAGALRRLDELGTLVLAGPTYGNLTLNLYTDLHRRSLTVAGVPAPTLNGTPSDVWRMGVPPARVSAGNPVPPGASWYLVAP